jgi:RNase H-like domain found in reverse transcriptase
MDFTGKGVPARVPWGDEQRKALARLQSALCEATERPLHIISHCNEFSLYVDCNDFAIRCMVTQFDHEGIEIPVVFASSKLSSSQLNWAIIEKEAYAAIWSLQKFRHWLFAAKRTLYSDHNPLSYLSESSPKSAKLLR